MVHGSTSYESKSKHCDVFLEQENTLVDYSLVFTVSLLVHFSL